MTSLEYNTFKNTVESLTTTDRNTADFIFMMCLSRNVVSHVGSAANKAKNFFRRYIGANYIPKLADAGGVVRYFLSLKEHHDCEMCMNLNKMM
jgi:hypothetical protein